MSETIHHQVVIVGGGTAGISVAARLTNGWFNKRDVAVIEPAVDLAGLTDVFIVAGMKGAQAQK